MLYSSQSIKKHIEAIHFISFWILFTTHVVIVSGIEKDTNNHMPLNFDIEKGNPKSLKSVTQYKYPQFREVSPCSCDVTENKCDIGCCCDSQCQEENNVNITCIPGKMFFLGQSICSIVKCYYICNIFFNRNKEYSLLF